MFWTNRKSLLIVAAAAAMLFLGTSRADAIGYHHYRTGFYRTGYYRTANWGYRAANWGCGSCWTPCATYCRPTFSRCCDPCGPSTCCQTGCSSCSYYLGCRPGPIRRAVLGPYRWYATNCYASCGTCDTCCSSDAGSAPTAPEAPTKAEKPTVAPGEVDPLGVEPEPTTRSQPTRDNSGLLTIYVPFDAKVTVNGHETASKGSRRQYVSFGLKPGLAYKYEIRAEVLRDGRPAIENRTVTLTAGDHTSVAFGFNVSTVEGLAAK